MQVKEVSITDVRNIDGTVTFKPGALNVICGDNGVGKTTYLKAFEAVFKGLHRPTLRRDRNYGKPGAPDFVKKAEVQFLLDNGGTITRTITEKTSTTVATNPDGTEIPCPQEFVSSLATGFGFDPLSFIEAKAKDRLAYLQRAIGIQFTPEEVASCCRLKPPKTVDLDGIDLIRDQLYKSRTKENTLAKQAKGTVDRLSGVIVAEEARDWPAEVVRIQSERDALQSRVVVDERGITAKVEATRADINARFDEAIRRLNAARDRHLKAVEAAEKDAVAELHEANRAQMEALTAGLATAQERARRVAQNDVIRAEIATAEGARDTHTAESKSLTGEIDGIDKLKADKLSALEAKLPGMTVHDGELYCDGTLFDDLNTGEQYLKSFQIANLQPGELGIIIADKAEHLGPDNWELFQDAAVQSGFQVYVTRVCEGPLEVRVFNDQAAA